MIVRRRESETHFRESERRSFRNVYEIADDREAEAEAEGVALHFGDADEATDVAQALAWNSTSVARFVGGSRRRCARRGFASGR